MENTDYDEIKKIMNMTENEHFAKAKMYTADRLWAAVYTRFLCKHCASEPMESVSVQDIKILKDTLQEQGIDLNPFKNKTPFKNLPFDFYQNPKENKK